MVKVLASDSNNDLYIGRDGYLAVRNNIEAVMQACQQAAQAQLGEMVLSIDTGVPNFQTVWQSAANVVQFEAYLRKTLKTVEGVIEVKTLLVEVRNNAVVYQATIVTIYGTGVITNG